MSLTIGNHCCRREDTGVLGPGGAAGGHPGEGAAVLPPHSGCLRSVLVAVITALLPHSEQPGDASEQVDCSEVKTLVLALTRKSCFLWDR